jgi:hypothetical protein
MLIVGYFLDLIFTPEDGGNMFLRSLLLSRGYTALHPEGENSS